jgi:hypothetical protein
LVPGISCFVPKITIIIAVRIDSHLKKQPVAANWLDFELTSGVTGRIVELRAYCEQRVSRGDMPVSNGQQKNDVLAD